MGEVLDLEQDVEKVLDEHKILLNRHSEDITDLQIKSAGFEEKLNGIDSQIGDIKTTLTRMENNSLQSTSVLTQTMSQIVMNTSNSTTQMHNNRTQIYLKALGILAGLFTAYFVGKGINITF